MGQIQPIPFDQQHKCNHLAKFRVCFQIHAARCHALLVVFSGKDLYLSPNKWLRRHHHLWIDVIRILIPKIDEIQQPTKWSFFRFIHFCTFKESHWKIKTVLTSGRLAVGPLFMILKVFSGSRTSPINILSCRGIFSSTGHFKFEGSILVNMFKTRLPRARSSKLMTILRNKEWTSFLKSSCSCAFVCFFRVRRRTLILLKLKRRYND